MRKSSTICLFAFLIIFCGMAFNSSKIFAADVLINKENFPGDSFREYVRSVIDENKDGVLSEAEVLAVKGIFTIVEKKEDSVSDYKGIEYFSNLEELEILGYDEIYSVRTVDVMLDVSKNVKLKKLTCQASELRQLDLSGLTQLEEVKLSTDTCPNQDLSKLSKLKNLEISWNRALTGNESSYIILGDMPLLQNLKIYGFTRVQGDFQKMPALQNLSVTVSAIEIDLSGNQNLKSVYCSEVKNMSSIQLQNCPNLDEVLITCTGVHTVNVHNCPKVKKLAVTQVPGTGCLRIIGGEGVTWLAVSGETIPELDIKDLVSLRILHLGGDIKKVELHNAQEIKSLVMGGVKKFDFSPYTALENLSINNMKMKQLDLRKHDKLKRVKCYDMKKLEKLQLSKQAEYSKVTIKKTKIRKLDVRKVKVEELIYADNKAKQLLVKGNRTIKRLDCRNNQLTKLDLRGCSKLQKRNLFYTGNKKLKKNKIKK